MVRYGYGGGEMVPGGDGREGWMVVFWGWWFGDGDWGDADADAE